jgi:hypothetical protein
MPAGGHSRDGTTNPPASSVDARLVTVDVVCTRDAPIGVDVWRRRRWLRCGRTGSSGVALALLVVAPEDTGDGLDHRTLGVFSKVRPVCLGLPEARAVVVFREGVLRAELPTAVVAGVGERVGGSTQVTLGHLTEL